MHETTRHLLCIAASVAANCGPCFEHYHAKALAAGLGEADIREAMDVGAQMKRGASINMHTQMTAVLDRTVSNQSAGGASSGCGCT